VRGIGHKRETRQFGGCVLHERYQTAKGYSGESLSTTDATGAWVTAFDGLYRRHVAD
jgi:hypothetical protein